MRKEYVDGLIEQRKLAARYVYLFSWASVIASLFLGATTGTYNVAISGMGISLSNLPITADFLALVTAMMYAGQFIYAFNFYAIDIVIKRIHAVVRNELKEILCLDRVGDYAFGLLIEPRLTGYRSTIGHMLIVFVTCVASLAIYGAFLLTPAFAIFNYARPILEAPFSNSWFIAALSCAVVGTGLSFFVLAIIPFKYTWKPRASAN